MAKKLVETFVWCLCYINKDYIDQVSTDLAKNPKYSRVEAYIPTVKLLKKQFKGKKTFEEIPALFNYGFFRIPRSLAIIPENLRRLKADIPAIYAWVKDPASVFNEGPILSAGNKETRFNSYEYSVATASDEEISLLLATTKEYSIYSEEDIKTLVPGSLIVLHGFPFDNVPAIINGVDLAKKEVKVTLELFKVFKEVTVSFENIFYTIYKAKESMGNEDKLISLDMVKSHYGSSKVDNLLFNANHYSDEK